MNSVLGSVHTTVMWHDQTYDQIEMSRMRGSQAHYGTYSNRTGGYQAYP